MRRAAVLIAVAYCLATAVWLVGQLLTGADPALTAQRTANALLIVQFLAVGAVAPWIGASDQMRGDPTAVAMLVITAWPLYTFLMLMVELSIVAVAAGQLLLTTLAALSYVAARAAHTKVQSSVLRQQTITALQFLPVAVVWVTRDGWVASLAGTT